MIAELIAGHGEADVNTNPDLFEQRQRGASIIAAFVSGEDTGRSALRVAREVARDEDLLLGISEMAAEFLRELCPRLGIDPTSHANSYAVLMAQLLAQPQVSPEEIEAFKTNLADPNFRLEHGPSPDVAVPPIETALGMLLQALQSNVDEAQRIMRTSTVAYPILCMAISLLAARFINRFAEAADQDALVVLQQEALSAQWLNSQDDEEQDDGTD